MRFIVFGAGGIGSALGGMLAHSGHTTLLVARPEHAQAINERGLVIADSKGELRVDVAAVSSLDEVVPLLDDIILLTVKTFHTPTALQQLSAWTGSSIPVVCLQNGVRNEAMTQAYFVSVIGGLVHFNANYLSPGRIERPLWNTIGLGLYPEGVNELVETVAAALTTAGFKVHRHPFIMRSKWGKLIANLNNATNAITDTYLQRSFALPEYRQFVAEVMTEGITVVDRAGITLDDGGIFDVREMVKSLRKPPDQDRNWLLPEGERSYPSTWQDLMLGRGQTEVRFFNGEIIGLGAAHGIPTPYNSVLLRVIESMERAGEKPGRYSLAELIEMVEEQKREFQL